MPSKEARSANLNSGDPLSTEVPTDTEPLLSKEHEEDSVARILLNIYYKILFTFKRAKLPLSFMKEQYIT